MNGYTEDDLKAAPLFTTIHLKFENQRYPWRFTKTTAHNWRCTRTDKKAAWADHGHLAYLITQATLTNSIGQPQ